MTRLSRLLPALLFVPLAACAARVTGSKEAAREPSPATSPSGGGESSAEVLEEAVPTLGRAGAEAPSGGLPEEDGAEIVIDWARSSEQSERGAGARREAERRPSADELRRHAASDAEFGVNVKRNDHTGGVTPSVPPAETPAAVEGAGTPH